MMYLTLALFLIGLACLVWVCGGLVRVARKEPLEGVPRTQRGNQTADRLDRISGSLRAELRDWEGRAR